MEISASLGALLGYVVWTLALVLIVVDYRVVLVLTGKKRADEFPRRGYEPPAFIQRVQDAHANTLENLPVAAAVLLAAMTTGQTAVTDPLACWLLYARIGQSVVHMIAVNHWMVLLRATFLILQFGILGWWILKLTNLL
ncbi:MAG: MAPEG family protein [Nevskiales bacterium]